MDMSAQQAVDAVKTGASYVAGQLGLGSAPEDSNNSPRTEPERQPAKLSDQGLGSNDGASHERNDSGNELGDTIPKAWPVSKRVEQAYFLDQPDTLESHCSGDSFAADAIAALHEASRVGMSASQTAGATFTGWNCPGAGRTNPESDTVLGTTPNPEESSTRDASQGSQSAGGNKKADPHDPYWQGKDTAREHLDHRAKEGVARENESAIPTAGGERLGKKH